MVKRDVEMLKLRSSKPISKSEIPSLNKGGFVHNMDEFQDVRTICQYVKANGVSPAEAFDVADFDKVKATNKEAAKMKTLVSSFITACRRELKAFQVDKKLELKQRGKRLFLVSTE
jgi:hypothetical protein